MECLKLICLFSSRFLRFSKLLVITSMFKLFQVFGRYNMHCYRQIIDLLVLLLSLWDLRFSLRSTERFHLEINSFNLDEKGEIIQALLHTSILNLSVLIEFLLQEEHNLKLFKEPKFFKIGNFEYISFTQVILDSELN